MLRIGILGAGSIASTMAATLRAMKARGDSVELQAVASRDLARAEAFAAREGFLHAYGDYSSLVRDPDVDLIYIATPHSHHAAQAIMCIQAGKATLVEKPFTANAGQAEEVLELAERRQVLCTEAMWTRYMPSRHMIDEIIASGEIGHVRLLTANLCYALEDKERIIRPELAGGALLDVGVYCLNFASMVLGNDIVETHSWADLMPTGVDRTNSIVQHYGSGVVAQLMSSAACLSDRAGLIYGNRGYLRVDNINNPSRVDIYGPERGGPLLRSLPVPEQLTGYEYEVLACKRALEKGRWECPEMPHSETLTILRQMDALRASWGIRYPFE